MTKKLQLLLYVITVYLAAFGLLFLLAPSVAEQFTKSLHDPGLTILYGQYSLTFAFVAFLAAREKKPSSKLLLVILVLLIGHVLVFGYELLSSRQAFAQAGPPVIVNAVLAVLLALFRREQTA